MGKPSMTDADMAQYYFILPALPVGRLPISQDQLDRLKLVHNCTTPILLPSGKNILADMMFINSIGYTNMAGYPIEIMSLLETI